MTRRRWLIIIIDFLILFIILGSYKKTDSNRVVTSDDTSAYSASDISTYDLNITYDSDIDNKYIDEVRQAFYLLPPDVIKGFADDGWKIVITNNIDFADSDFTGDESNYITTGLTTYKKKMIQVKPAVYSDIDNFVMLKSLHELCHYADTYYGNVSDKKEWNDIYNKYKGSYTEYEFYGIKETIQNRADIEYANSDKYEMFACTMKDYLHAPDYLRDNYPEIYQYFQKLTK